MAKRAKVEQANHGSLAQSAASSQSSGPGIGFRLLKVDRIPEWANRYAVHALDSIRRSGFCTPLDSIKSFGGVQAKSMECSMLTS